MQNTTETHSLNNYILGENRSRIIILTMYLLLDNLKIDTDKFKPAISSTVCSH